MGVQESKPGFPSTPETPRFSSYAKLFTLTNDPRSPISGDRTPMLVQEQLADPRSPSSVDRTPVFCIPEPVSPFVRYKMENPAYQDSPLSSVAKADHDDKVISQESRLTRKTNGEVEIQKEGDSDMEFIHERKKPFKSNRNINNSKKKQSLLKTALFKSFVDINSDETDQTECTTQEKNFPVPRAPLSTRNFVIYTNKNINTENIDYKSNNKDRNMIKPNSFTSDCDKENMLF